jgi:hypothetical protein
MKLSNLIDRLIDLSKEHGADTNVLLFQVSEIDGCTSFDPDLDVVWLYAVELNRDDMYKKHSYPGAIVIR